MWDVKLAVIRTRTHFPESSKAALVSGNPQTPGRVFCGGYPMVFVWDSVIESLMNRLLYLCCAVLARPLDRLRSLLE